MLSEFDFSRCVVEMSPVSADLLSTLNFYHSSISEIVCVWVLSSNY